MGTYSYWEYLLGRGECKKALPTYGPPNPRPTPRSRRDPLRAQETMYMNPRLRDDAHFWWGFGVGATVACFVYSTVALILIYLV